MKKLLIADGGSSKTDWCVVSEGRRDEFCTKGINPYLLSSDEILSTLRREVCPLLRPADVYDVYFYGAGCNESKQSVMKQLLEEAFPGSAVSVETDLLGAARALCRREPGLVGLLGTGSNSGLYDGERMVQSVPPLGYILGDEGSGACLGRRFLAGLLRGEFPETLSRSFFSQTGLTAESILESVYRQPTPNRFLASFGPFLFENRRAIHHFLVHHLRKFFRKQLALYGRKGLPVSFVGSIAWYFREELTEASEREGFRIEKIEARPLLSLVDFHAC